MVRRTQKLSKNEDLFLFGPRGSGKTTLLKALFANDQVLWIDLLSEEDEESFGHHPAELSKRLDQQNFSYVVVDEIQKFPKLLDVIQKEIEKKKKHKCHFILTGSSARKLKRSCANLLGGRASTYFLFPFSSFELGNKFNLMVALQYGTLPVILKHSDNEKKEKFLRSYVKNYLKEEILVEQIVRNIEPFRDFLEVASQMNGEIINYSRISHDIGVSDKTIQGYYQILEDTLIGFLLKPFHRSIRKRQRAAPKFYFFDCGVKRALDRTISIPLVPKTSEFGKAFEHWVICEVSRLIEYSKPDYKMSYLRTKDDAEIDLIIERPGAPDLLLEIKSTDFVTDHDVRYLNQFLQSWDRPVEAQLWSREDAGKKISNISCVHWQKGLKELMS